MAEWTRDDVTALAPEFAAVDPAILDQFVARAEPMINPAVFGDRVVYAGALLTAHLLTRFPPAGVTPSRAGAVGPIESQSVGGISVSYAVPHFNAAMINASLGSTSYGIEFSRIVAISSPTPWVL